MPTSQLPKRLPLAVVVLTLNEERHLPECLASAVALGERMLVLDSGSTDDTVRIARQLGADVETRTFDGYASQRNAALAMVEQEWVLFLDADERLTPALRVEITQAIRNASPEIAGFWIPRRNRMFGREIRGGGWWPDYQLRLLRRQRARYQPERQVHEVVALNGARAQLSEPILHLNYDSMREFRAKQAMYSALRAKELREQGVGPRPRTFAGQPTREFWRRFVTLAGYRDRTLGLVLAATMAWYELQTWRQVAALSREAAKRERSLLDKPGDSQEVEGHATLRDPLPDPDLDLSIVIVSYNVRELLLACLASIEASLSCCELRTEVIVVDNDSQDASADAVRRRFPEATLIESGGNHGYASAINRGMRVARGRTIVLLNPDTTIAGDAFGILAGYLHDHPTVGVVGPRLVYPDGSTQPTRRRFPTLLTGLLESTIVQDYWHENGVLHRYYVRDRSDDEAQEVDWLVGACLALRREVADSAGLFDERFFMYSEEVEWCHRVRAAGWRIVYLPDAMVIHHEGASSRQDIPARQINFDTSKVLLFERLHGRRAARLLRAYLLTTYVLRIAIEGSKALLGHKPSLRMQRVRVYLQALRSGLSLRGTSR